MRDKQWKRRGRMRKKVVRMAKREKRGKRKWDGGERGGDLEEEEKSESEKSARARWGRGDEERRKRKTGERRGLIKERRQKKASLEDTLV